MKQTKHEKCIYYLQGLTRKYDLPELPCIDCIFAKFKRVKMYDYNTKYCFSKLGLSDEERSIVANHWKGYPAGQLIWTIEFENCKKKRLMWIYHEFKEINSGNPQLCTNWKYKTKNRMKYVQKNCVYVNYSGFCYDKQTLFEKTQLELQPIKLFSQEMSNFLKKAPKIRIPNNPLKLGVLL